MKEQQKRLYMTGRELAALFAHLENLSRTARNKEHRYGYYKFGLFCEVLLNTGMRRGELLALKVEHVDFENNVIRVEDAKWKKRREVLMTRRVSEILTHLSPTLFTDVTASQVTHKFTACAKTLHLKGIKLHSMRHTFGTCLLAMGYDITVAKELLGHQDINTTLVYAKADIRLLRAAIGSLNDLSKNGYKMVTKGGDGSGRLLRKKGAAGNDEDTNTYSARNRT
jgi:integrase